MVTLIDTGFFLNGILNCKKGRETPTSSKASAASISTFFFMGYALPAA